MPDDPHSTASRTGSAPGPDLGDRFEPIRRLGRGGSGEAWLVLDREVGEPVVAKILRPPVATEAETESASARADERTAFESLRRECARARRLRHPSIVPVYDLHRADDCLVLTQEYVEGRPAGEVLRGGDPITILALGETLADALAHAHGKGVVHRDVKASNVLVDAEGQPHLLDFGLSACLAPPEGGSPASSQAASSKAASSQAASSQETGARGAGSRFAMSPQQLAGESPRAEDDVYALGCLLYDLLCGQPPFWPEATDQAIRERVPEPVRAAGGRALPEGVVALVAAMLAKEPEQRPDLATVGRTLRLARGRLETEGQAPPRLVPPPRRIPSARTQSPRAQTGSAAPLTAPHAAPAGPPSPDPFLPRPVGGVRARRSGIGIGTVLAFTVLGLLAVAVFALLPGWVEPASDNLASDDLASDDLARGAPTGDDPQQAAVRVAEQEGSAGENEPDKAPLDATTPDPATLDPEERRRQAAERLRARRVLERLASRLADLEEKAVEDWAGPAWGQVERQVEAGRLRFEGRDWPGAMAAWEQASDDLDQLENRVPRERDAALDEADTALAAGQVARARAAYELAATLDPTSERARRGQKRTEVWNEVESLLDDARAFESNGDLSAAHARFERAASLDGASREAREGVARISTRLADHAFGRALSAGFAALEAERWEAARAAFLEAEAARPGNPEAARAVADARARLATAETVWKLDQLRQTGRQLEAAEAWRAAAARYGEALEIDPAVAFALDGRERANARAELSERMRDHLAHPDRLSDATVLDEVRRLLARAENVGAEGAAHRDQVARLSALVDAYAEPLPVRLSSDGATQVLVHRVGRLGTFLERQLELRPGVYTVVGSRPGYRDVRLEWKVEPGSGPATLDVRCTEAI